VADALFFAGQFLFPSRPTNGLVVLPFESSVRNCTGETFVSNFSM